MGIHSTTLLLIRRSSAASRPPATDRYLPVYVLEHALPRADRRPGRPDERDQPGRRGDGGYYARKVLHTSGKNRCFDQVEVEIWLDDKKQLVRHEVQGGQWLTAEEYADESRPASRSASN